jgi:hypothetical protein
MQAYDDPVQLEVDVAFELGIPVRTVREVSRALLEHAAQLLAERGSVCLFAVGRLSAVRYNGKAPAAASLNEPRPSEGRLLTEMPKVEIKLRKGEFLRSCLRQQRLAQAAQMEEQPSSIVWKGAVPQRLRADQVGT